MTTVTAQVHAELTADGATIVLVPDYEAVIHWLPRLKLATPAFKPSQPKGGILLPATWAGVVQCAAILGPAWRPGPRLHAWITAQISSRAPATMPSTLRRNPPAGRRPRPYQVAGAAMIGAVGRALLFDEQGCIYGDAGMSINRNGKGYTLKLRDLVARFNGTAVGPDETDVRTTRDRWRGPARSHRPRMVERDEDHLYGHDRGRSDRACHRRTPIPH